MPKKATASKKKSAGFMAHVHQIEVCIQQDYAHLEKAYPKAISDVEKEIIRVGKEIKKAKITERANKKTNKPIRGKQSKISNVTLLENQLMALKEEKVALIAGQKKMKARKKVWQKFEKSWTKKLKEPKKSKKPRKATKSTNSSGKPRGRPPKQAEAMPAAENE